MHVSWHVEMFEISSIVVTADQNEVGDLFNSWFDYMIIQESDVYLTTLMSTTGEVLEWHDVRCVAISTGI